MVWYGMVWYGMVWYGMVPGCTRFVMAPQPPTSAKNRTLHSDVDISGKQDRCYGPPLLERSDDDDDDDDDHDHDDHDDDKV